MKQTTQECYEDMLTDCSILDDVILTESISEFKPALEAFKSWLNAHELGDKSRILETGAAVVVHVKQYVAKVAIAQGIAE
jgi:hypothetical protein